MACWTVKQAFVLSFTVSLLASVTVLPSAAKKTSPSTSSQPGRSATGSANDSAPATIPQFEQRLFLKTYPKETLSARVERIEKQVFGDAVPGPLDQRISKLGEVLQQQTADEKQQQEITGEAAPEQSAGGNGGAGSTGHKAGGMGGGTPPAAKSSAMTAEEAAERQRIQVQAAREEQISSLLGEGVELYRKKKGLEAQKKFEQVLAIDPQNAQAHFNMGIIKESMGAYVEALGHYKQAAQGDPDNKDYSDAIAAIQPKAEKMRQAMGEHAEFKKLAAEANGDWQRGDFISALDKYMQLDQKEPNKALIKYNIGSIYLKMKDQPKALEYYKEAHKLEPGEAKYNKAYEELAVVVKKEQKEQEKIQEEAQKEYKESQQPQVVIRKVQRPMAGGQQMMGQQPMRVLGGGMQQQMPMTGGGMMQQPMQGGGMMMQQPMNGGGTMMQQQPMQRSAGTMQQPVGMMQLPMNSGMMQQQQPMTSGMMMQQQPMNGGGMMMQQQPMNGGGMMMQQQPMNSGGMMMQQQPMNSGGMMMQQQPMNSGVMQQPMNSGVMQQQPMNSGMMMQQQPMNSGMMMQQPMNGSVMMQQPMNGNVMMQQPMNGGMMQQPMNSGMMQQPMNSGMMQQPMNSGMMQQPMIQNSAANNVVAMTSMPPQATQQSFQPMGGGMIPSMNVASTARPTNRTSFGVAPGAVQSMGIGGTASGAIPMVQSAANLMASFGIAGRSNGQGVTVTGVGIASRAASGGLVAGDDIRAVDGNQISSPSEIDQALSKANTTDKVKFMIMRNGNLAVLDL